MGPWRLQMFTFDRFGIRFGIRNFDEALTTTLPKECNNNTEVCEAIRPIVNPSMNTANNRLDGYIFDNAGNTTRDAESRRFTFDGENKQVKVETLDLNGNPVSAIGEYSYDGDGKRIKKEGIAPNGQPELTVFVYDAAGKLIGDAQRRYFIYDALVVSALSISVSKHPTFFMLKDVPVQHRRDGRGSGETELPTVRITSERLRCRR